MRQTILILYFIFFCLIISAQKNTIALHPVVGDTIDKGELNKYFLFNEYSLDGIDYIVLKERKSLYYLFGYHSDSLILQTEVSEDLLLSQKNNIEKLNKYFTTANDKDSIIIDINTDSISIDQIDLNYKTPEFYKNIKKENRRKFWQEKREEIKSNREKGMIY